MWGYMKEKKVISKSGNLWGVFGAENQDFSYTFKKFALHYTPL